MEFNYLEQDAEHPLIDHFYQLKIEKKDLPFKSLILPLGQTNITYVKSKKKQISKHPERKEIHYDGLIVTGQCYGSYEVSILEESYNFGFSLKPTALYKILKRDISQFNNQHVSLKEIDVNLYEHLNPLFTNSIKDIRQFVKATSDFFENYSVSDDKNIAYIDNAIDLIIEKEGLLKVSEILEITPFSQKKLELLFKKVIGFTPGKFIKQYRFMKLMRKYESNEFDLNELQYMFNYYDNSHFSKDFQHFMNQTPKAYFKNNYPLLKRYLKE